MRTRHMSVLTLCGLSLLFSQLPTLRAGSLNIAPSTIYGTAISFSASYPDFRFGDSPTNISLLITVTFNNASISAVNITAVYVRLYYSDVNLTQVGYPPSAFYQSYAEGSWLSTDEWSDSPHAPQKIQISSPEITSATWSVDPLTLYYHGERTQEVQAKLYIVVTLCFLDTNGQLILHSTGVSWPFNVGYHWGIFTGEGEAPYVTVYPKAQSDLSTLYLLALVISVIGLVLVMTAVIVMRRNRAKRQISRKEIHPPPPSQPLHSSRKSFYQSLNRALYMNRIHRMNTSRTMGFLSYTLDSQISKATSQ